tara:strand:- start:1051 stop:1761 length:711 start_codon:yes stop_codon:yes gene_type:complete
MSEGDEVFEEGNQVSVFFRDQETRTAMGIYTIVLILVTAKIFYSLALKDSYLHDEVRFEDNWELSFTEETTTLSETVLLPDGGEEDLEFAIDVSAFPEGYRIGLVNVKISYSETNQAILDDPCDSVQASITQTNYPAQWTDQNNTLNGGSNSCDDIDLTLKVYPNYNGENYERMAHNAVVAVDEWVEDGFGIGDLSVNVQLDVQRSQVPTQDDDDDETVQIDVIVVAFKANAEKLE